VIIVLLNEAKIWATPHRGVFFAFVELSLIIIPL
jgi:hypothetical protein